MGMKDGGRLEIRQHGSGPGVAAALPTQRAGAGRPRAWDCFITEPFIDLAALC